MLDEEKKAIEYFKEKIKNKLPLYEETYVDGKPYRRNILQLETNFTEEQANKTEIVLNLIEKQSKEIKELKDEQEKEKNKEMSCDLTETRADNIDESTMLKQIKLKLQEKNIPIETLLAEFERLEDLEDDLTIVYLNGVYDGEKKVKDKIKAKIEEYEQNVKDFEEYWSKDPRKFPKTKCIDYYKLEALQSLLEKE